MGRHGIGELSKLLGVSKRTLRYYEEVGVLEPKSRGTNNYRYYDSQDLSRIQAVLVMRKAGLSLKEVLDTLGPAKASVLNQAPDQQIMIGQDLAQKIKTRLLDQKTRLEQKINELFEAKSLLDHSMESLQGCLNCETSLTLDDCVDCHKGCPEVIKFASLKASKLFKLKEKS